MPSCQQFAVIWLTAENVISAEEYHKGHDLLIEDIGHACVGYVCALAIYKDYIV